MIKMMFKAIYMHTKPLKHTKKHANTNELHQQNTFCSKSLTNVSKWIFFSKTPILIYCMHLRMDVSYLFKKTKPLKSIFLIVFVIFTYPLFVIL